MEKNIKDYLHFYLGCVCKVFTSIEGELVDAGYNAMLVGIAMNGFCKMELGKDLVGKDISEIKPILRHLSDMTEDEKLELYGMGFTCNSKGMQILHPSEWNAFKPSQFQYLLSKGFDLFGLIDAGLANKK